MRQIKLGGWIFICLFLLASCSGPAAFERPNGVAPGQNGSLYVMDFGNHRIVQVNEAGKILKTIGKFGAGQSEIYFGWDAAVDAQGNVYIGNVVRDNEGTHHDGIKVFSSEGQFLREIGKKDYPENNEGNANLPYGIDVDNQGRIYTADYGTNIIRVFSPAGKLLLQLPGDEQGEFSFTNPGDVAVDDQRELVYISDFTMGKLLQFKLQTDEAGNISLVYLKSIGSYGRASGQFAFPQNLAVDDDTGTVYVGDLANRRVQAFDSEGNYVKFYAPSDVTDWQVLGLAYQNGKIYAGDALNNTIWIFYADGRPAQQMEVQR